MEKNLKYEIAKEIVDVVEKNVLKTIDEIIQNKYKKLEEIQARKDVEEILQLMEMDEMAIRKLHETFYEINDYYCDAINEEGGDM